MHLIYLRVFSFYVSTATEKGEKDLEGKEKLKELLGLRSATRSSQSELELFLGPFNGRPCQKLSPLAADATGRQAEPSAVPNSPVSRG